MPVLLSVHPCVLALSEDEFPDHPDEQAIAPDERFAVGNEIIVTDCGEIGRANDRFKFTCTCGSECRQGLRLKIAKIVPKENKEGADNGQD